jgi:hypothetical protein
MIRRNTPENSGKSKSKKGEKSSPNLSKARFGIKCEVCGNEYDKPMEIVVNGISRHFDSFECAIHALAPVCDHCGVRVIGHGVEAGGVIFCCAHCAAKAGVESVKDRA